MSNSLGCDKIFPNPNSGIFTLKIENEIQNGELILFNCLGQKVHGQEIVQSENNITTNGLARGLYHYIVSQDGQQVANGKLVIE